MFINDVKGSYICIFLFVQPYKNYLYKTEKLIISLTCFHMSNNKPFISQGLIKKPIMDLVFR